MAIERFIPILTGTLAATAALGVHADVPIAPTHCTGHLCIATYETMFSLREIRTLKPSKSDETVLMFFEPSLVTAIVLGDRVSKCHSTSGKIPLRRKGDTYLGGACFQIPSDTSNEYVAVGIAIKTSKPIEEYLGFDGLCVWVKESVPGGYAGNWKAQRLGLMRCVMGPNNSFKPKPLRGSA